MAGKPLARASSDVPKTPEDSPKTPVATRSSSEAGARGRRFPKPGTPAKLDTATRFNFAQAKTSSSSSTGSNPGSGPPTGGSSGSSGSGSKQSSSSRKLSHTLLRLQGGSMKRSFNPSNFKKFRKSSKQQEGDAEKAQRENSKIPPPLSDLPTILSVDGDLPSPSTPLPPSPGADSTTASALDEDIFILPADNQSERSSLSEPCSPTSKKQADNYVGFSSLPNQVFRKSVKRGFQFTLMVVGESGLGKSTLINSLFLTDLYVNDGYEDAVSKVGKTMAINASTSELKEGGVRLHLTVVDTPGFGDSIDNTDCWNAVIQVLESKFEDYLNAESRVNRTAIHDTRVHCCLYFIAPTGHGLKPLDIEFMGKLHNKVNIIPVVAKADTLTADECAQFKQQILKEIETHKINIYRFPPLADEEAENDLASRRRVPFAVVGSNTLMEVDGRKVRGRRYPWGVVEVENQDHCDFIALRNLLIRTHMQDLIDVTNDVHYENFRSERLSQLTGGGASITNSFATNSMDLIEREREEQEQKLVNMEKEMEAVFDLKVREKRKKLRDSDLEFNRKFEATMKTLQQSKREIEERRRKFEQEREHFGKIHAAEELNNKGASSGKSSSLTRPDKKDKKKGKFS